jgi:D-alanyl-D-alanine carboxypeptidase
MTAAWTWPTGQTETVSIGMSDKEKNVPMRGGDRMLAGSIGKTYFAAAIMRMVEAGQLDLDRKVAFYVGNRPWFKRIPNASTITLRQLMNHSSGIPEHVESPDFVSAMLKEPAKEQSPEEILSFVLDKKPLFEAGKGWAYADTNFILAAYTAESVAKKPLYSVIEAEILRPLRLSRTSPSTSQTLEGLVQGYSMPNSPFRFSGPTLKDGKYYMFNPQMEWAGGGFITTSSELSRWAKALFEGKAIGQSAVQKMIDGAVPARTGPGDQYGLGVQIRQSEFGPSYGHGGWFPGYLSEVEYFPDLKVAVAVQFNTDEMRMLRGRPTKYTREIAKILRDALAKK